MSAKKTAPKKKSTQPEVEVAQPQIQELSAQDEIAALRSAHDFFGSYQNVPGFAAAQWGRALDTIALVANSLISKGGFLEQSDKPTDQPSA